MLVSAMRVRSRVSQLRKHQATFFAGLQGQMLSGSSLDNSTTAAKLVNAFWYAGIFCDIFGAVLATMTARWFELLEDKEVEVLKKAWSGDRTALPSPRQVSQSLFLYFVDSAIAFTLFAAFPIVAGGVILFLIGLVIDVWRRQPLLVCIISTIPVAIISPLIVLCFYPHSSRKTGIIVLLARKRGAW